MREWPVRKAIEATTAAPDFFPACNYGSRDYLDGAMAANNPTELAIHMFFELKNAEPIKLRAIVESSLRA